MWTKLMDSNTHRSWAERVLHPPARGGVSVHLLLSMGKVWPALCVFQKKTSLITTWTDQILGASSLSHSPSRSIGTTPQISV